MLGGVLVALGVLGGVENPPEGIVYGTGFAAAGLWSLAVDAPLSLVGDVVTFPIAYARSQRAPWAMWWGSQSSSPQPADPDKASGEEAAPPAGPEGRLPVPPTTQPAGHEVEPPPPVPAPSLGPPRGEE
jgi:hypothetical protein